MAVRPELLQIAAVVVPCDSLRGVRNVIACSVALHVVELCLGWVAGVHRGRIRSGCGDTGQRHRGSSNRAPELGLRVELASCVARASARSKVACILVSSYGTTSHHF